MNIFTTAEARTRRAGRDARRTIQGRTDAGPGWVGAALLAAGTAAAGAIAATLLDPARGRARRTRIVDQGTALARRAAREAGHAMRAGRSLAAGKIEAARLRGSRVAPVDDVSLADRAESVLFRDADVPKGSINLNVERGILVLRGEVPSDEMRLDLERRAAEIDGVWSVRNLLRVPGEEHPVEALAATR